METKICLECKQEKPICEFNKGTKKSPYGKRPRCRPCDRIYNKKYYYENKERIRSTAMRPNRVQKRKETIKIYTIKNADILKDKRKNKYDSDAEKYRKITRDYYINNREKCIKNASISVKKRKEKCHLFRLKEALRLKIILAFKRNFDTLKCKKTNIILGASYEEVKKHIEKQFTDGMSWENRGFYGWHIDHIIPLASAKTEEELIKLCHYTNLQPLWWKDNLEKGAKILPGYLNKAS